MSNYSSELTLSRKETARLSVDLLIAERSSTIVVLRLSTSAYFRLNDSASEIICVVQEYGEEEGVRALAARRHIALEDAQSDLGHVLELLASRPGGTPVRGHKLTMGGASGFVRTWTLLPVKRTWDSARVIFNPR